MKWNPQDLEMLKQMKNKVKQHQQARRRALLYVPD